MCAVCVCLLSFFKGMHTNSNGALHHRPASSPCKQSPTCAWPSTHRALTKPPDACISPPATPHRNTSSLTLRPRRRIRGPATSFSSQVVSVSTLIRTIALKVLRWERGRANRRLIKPTSGGRTMRVWATLRVCSRATNLGRTSLLSAQRRTNKALLL